MRPIAWRLHAINPCEGATPTLTFVSDLKRRSSPREREKASVVNSRHQIQSGVKGLLTHPKEEQKEVSLLKMRTKKFTSPFGDNEDKLSCFGISSNQDSMQLQCVCSYVTHSPTNANVVMSDVGKSSNICISAPYFLALCVRVRARVMLISWSDDSFPLSISRTQPDEQCSWQIVVTQCRHCTHRLPNTHTHQSRSVPSPLAKQQQPDRRHSG